MTKTKSTKRALLSSVVALFLCFSMLLGTTYAWFTDSATSTNNVIKSGTLDVELYYADGTQAVPAADSTDWKKAQDVALYTADQLWEPGYTDAKHIKISNEGTLALKYQLAIIPTGEVSELAEVIDVYLYEIADTDANATQVATRAALDENMHVGTLADVISKGIVHGNLAADADYTTTVVLKMQENAGNEYQEKSIGDGFTIQLLATQMTAENDSFDDQYDKDAWVSGMAVYTAEDLQAAINAGETNIKLMDDITLDASIVIPAVATTFSLTSATPATVIDLNGKTITGTKGRDADNNRIHVIVNNGNLTIKDGTVKSAGNDGGSAIYNNEGATLTIEDVTLYGAPQSDPVYEVGVSKPFPSYAVNNYGNAVVNGATVKSYHGAIATGGNGVTVINDADIDVGLGQSTGITSYLIYSYDNAQVTVNGGKFAFTKQEIYVNGGNTFCELGTNPIMINGGNYIGTSFSTGADREYVIKGGTFDVDPSTYVADGFKAVENNGAYYVVANDVAGVIATADDLVALGGTKINGTYMLMADLDMTGKTMKPMEVSGGASVNFIGNDHTISNLTLNAAGIHGMTGASEVAGLFDLTAPATTVSLTVNDLAFAEATVDCSKYAAVVVGYNPNGGTTITLNNVDVAGATVTAESVAALVGYTTGALTMIDCDVSNLTLSGEFSENKVGAYVGTVNTATGAATVTNCTNSTAYNYAGRVIYDATMTIDGAYYVTTAAAFTSLMMGSESEVNIILADGKYENVLTSSNKTINIVGENKDGAEIALTNAVSSSHDHLGLTGCTVNLKNVKVTFEDGAYYAAYINNPTMTYTDCTITGQFYIYGDTNFIGCTFDNDDDAAKTAMRYTYIYDGNVVVDDCDFYTQGHGLIMYSDNGGAGDQTLTVKDSRFHGGAGRTAYAVANQNTAGIEIDGSCGANYTLILEGNNTFDEGFSGLWRIKAMKDGVTTTVNDTAYTGTSADVYLDGTHYTKDNNRNVTKG